jgi:hypothetical protein
VEGTATANFDANGYLFVDDAGAVQVKPLPFVKPGSTDPVHLGDLDAGGVPMGGGEEAGDAAPFAHEDPPNTQVASPKAQAWAHTIIVRNTGGTNVLEISFDGTNLHGRVLPNSEVVYRYRYESGIAVRSSGGTTFEVEAW